MSQVLAVKQTLVDQGIVVPVASAIGGGGLGTGLLGNWGRVLTGPVGMSTRCTDPAPLSGLNLGGLGFGGVGGDEEGGRSMDRK